MGVLDLDRYVCDVIVVRVPFLDYQIFQLLSVLDNVISCEQQQPNPRNGRKWTIKLRPIILQTETLNKKTKIHSRKDLH